MAGRILIVDSVTTNRIVLQVKLAAACYQPVMADSGAACLRLAREHRPDLILLSMPTVDQPTPALLRQLRADPRMRGVPVIVLAPDADPDTRLAALKAGADDVLSKATDEAVLLARMRSLLRTHEALAELDQRGETLQELGLAEAPTEFLRPGLIAFVSDRGEVAEGWRAALAGQMPDRLQVLSREAALVDQDHAAESPDVFVIDACSGGPGGGRRLMAELRSRSGSRHAGIVLLHRAPGTEEIVLAYDMGASEALAADLPAPELAMRLRALLRRKQAADRIRASVHDSLRLAVRDPLTGLYNRRFAEPRLGAIADRARALEAGYAVMIVDLDRFKTVNDAHGHASGDAVLIEVAQRLADNLRVSDLVARIGGDEFLIALPDCGLADAQATAGRLSRIVQDHPIRLPDGRDLALTVSIGLAVAPAEPPRTEEIDEMLARADRALLIAKAAGRNRVILGASAA